mmetsp:Transcript_21285/g.52449  ORF Transcript_21285/g.52449 Transcript_21285/m.52449 type:complete len:91 (-) Transcript_21285:3027-3299(-)
MATTVLQTTGDHDIPVSNVGGSPRLSKCILICIPHVRLGCKAPPQVVFPLFHGDSRYFRAAAASFLACFRANVLDFLDAFFDSLQSFSES